MNKILIIIILLLLLSIGLVSADLTDGLLHYYSFDNVTTDSVGSNDLANTGCTSVPTSGIIGGTYDYKDSGDYMQGTSLGSEISGLADLSINAWNNLNDNGGDLSFIMASTDGSGNHQILMYISTSNGVMYTISNTTIVSSPSSAIPVDGWTMITSVKTGTNLTLYINGIYSNSAVVSAKVITATNNFYVGRQNYFGPQGADGYIDELGIWNRSLSIDEIQDLYNSGSGTAYPWASPSFNIEAYDEYTSTPLTNFSAVISKEGTNLNATYDISGLTTAGGHWPTIWYNYTVYYNETVYNLPEACETTFTTDVAGETWSLFRLYAGDQLNKLSCYNGGGYSVITDTYVEGEDFSLLGSWEDEYTTTDGTIETRFYQNDTQPYNISVFSDVYIPKNYLNYDVSSNLNASIHASEIRFKVYQIINNFSLSPPIDVNFTIDSVKKEGIYQYFNLSVGEHTVLAEVENYFPLNYTFNVTALQTGYLNIQGIYNSKVTFNLKDIITEDVISKNSYVTIQNNKTGNLITYSNTNGTIEANLLKGTHYLTYYADDYANTTINLTINESTQEFNYTLYAYNSLWVTANDLDTGNPLDTFTITLIDTLNNTYNFNDGGTGTAIQNNITSGVYTATIEKENYTSADYPVTITGGSHNDLVAYLTAGSATNTIFTIQDLISTGIIEGATASQYRLINTTWTLISSEESDITGRIQFSYTDGIEYRFIISKTNYVERQFQLTPLFSSYTIRLTPQTSEDVDTHTGDFTYYISKKELYNGEVNNFTVSLTSGTGTISNYTLNITSTLFAGAYSYNCSNVYGCSYDFSENITGATSYSDTYTVSYYIYESGRNPKYFSRVYNIIGGYGEYTLQSWSEEDETDGVGDLEKGLISTLILLVVVGAIATGASFIGAPPLTTSGITLTVLIIVLASVGFVPQYVAWVVGFGGLLMAVFGRGTY